jgi:glycosyltransferase involved in cell wall biosynthesis
MARVDQLLPAAHAGDATGDAAASLAAALRHRGHDANLYALTIDAEIRDGVRPFSEYPAPGPDDLTLLHYALPSPLSEALTRYEGRRAIVYHNLTPPELLLPFCPDIARLTSAGREQLQWLADSGRVDLAIGVSQYNTDDLDATGFARTTTLPLSVDLSRYDVEPDRVLSERLAVAPPIFLTVGRVAPNKRLEDVLRFAAYYLRHVEPDAWFLIVGGTRGLEPYYDALIELHAELGLDHRVRFLGRVSHADLVALYRAASVYLCTSLHEGFCAPLLEAMHFEVPILARAAAAVPETLGGAGVLYDDPDPAAGAEMIHLLATDEALRGRLRQAGRARVADFAPDKVTAVWIEAIESFLAEE